MAITDAKKVDYLWKKLGYGKSKTETNVVRKAPEEAVASPLLLRGDKIWTQAHSIPITLPDDSTDGVVEVYHTGGVKECTELAGTNPSRTWQTGLVDWIPPEFGSTYQVKVYIHTSSNSGSAGNVAYEVAATGSGNNDEWFFDYQSGVLHFIGTNLPNGVNFSGKSVYVSGGRYIGQQGVQQFPDNFTFTGSTINQDVTNANFTFDTAGSGKFIFNTTTALQVPKGTTAQRPSAEEGVIRFNTTTSKYEVSQDGTTWTNLRTEHTAQEVKKDVFSGDGSTSRFESVSVATDPKNIIVYIDGVMQEPSENYTTDGSTSTITISEAPHTGARIVVMTGFAEAQT